MGHHRCFGAPLDSELASLRARDLHRSLPGARSGLVDLCSNDYLGFSGHPRLRAALRGALERLPLGSTGSRLVRGDHPVFRRAERRLADFKGAEAALLFSSGYLANAGLLGALAGPGDILFCDALNHASLIDGARLSGAAKAVYAHLDLKALESLLRKAPRSGRRLIVTESLFSMEGDIAPLPRLWALAREHGALLVVDEAHAFGVYGARGSGLLEAQGVPPGAVSVNTCGKALGLAGAAVCGPASVVELLVNRCRSFLFSTAMPPFLAEGIAAAVDLVEKERRLRERLCSSWRRARRILGAAGLEVLGSDSPILPVPAASSRAALEASEALREAGFDARAIRPPTVPEGTARLRLTVTTRLDLADFRKAARVLGEALSC